MQALRPYRHKASTSHVAAGMSDSTRTSGRERQGLRAEYTGPLQDSVGALGKSTVGVDVSASHLAHKTYSGELQATERARRVHTSVPRLLTLFRACEKFPLHSLRP